MTYELTIAPLRGNTSSEELLVLAKAMHAESRFARFPFDEELGRDCVQKIFFGYTSLAIGAFDLGVLSGVCTGVCGDILPITKSILASQHYLFLYPVYRSGGTAGKLVQAFIQEAKRRGAEDVVFSNGYGGSEKVDQLFELNGLTRLGGIYSLGD